MPDLGNPLSSEAAAAELDRQEANELVLVAERIQAVLADLDRIESFGCRSHTRTAWLACTGCLAARIRATLTGEDHRQ